MSSRIERRTLLMMAAGAGISGRVFGQHRPDRLDRSSRRRTITRAARPNRFARLASGSEARGNCPRYARGDGPLPGPRKSACPLDVKRGRTGRQRFAHSTAHELRSEPGGRVPPICSFRTCRLNRKQAAGVLCLHRTEKRPATKSWSDSRGPPNRQYAAELADRGYVTLAPPTRCSPIISPISRGLDTRAAR